MSVDVTFLRDKIDELQVALADASPQMSGLLMGLKVECDKVVMPISTPGWQTYMRRLIGSANWSPSNLSSDETTIR